MRFQKGGAMLINDFFQNMKITSVNLNRKQSIDVELLSTQAESICPVCLKKSGRIHSRYSRRLIDLPILGQTLQLLLFSRKFFCDNTKCSRKIFTERYSSLIKSYARRTDRLEEILIAVAFSSNAQTDSKLSRKMGFYVSRDTILRIIRKQPIKTNHGAEIVGVDDWAYRKNHTYGTIVCDQETGKPIDLFAGRESTDFAKWLEEHPTIKLITRDRSDSYSKAIKDTSPQIIEVADRFHISKNLLDTLKDFAQKTFASRIHIGYEEKPVEEEKSRDTATKAKQRQTQVRENKRTVVREVKKLRAQGMTIKAIASEMKIVRNTVMRYIRLDEETAISRRSSNWPKKLTDQYDQTIANLILSGNSARQIYIALQEQGCKASETTVWRRINQLKSQNKITKSPNDAPKLVKKWLKCSDVISYMWTFEDELIEEHKGYLDTVFLKFPAAKTAYSLVQKFRLIQKEKAPDKFLEWIEEAMASGISEMKSFAKGIKSNLPEVYNAYIYDYSNGLLEGHINRLKMIKRLMFGRANFDLLRQRVLHQM